MSNYCKYLNNYKKTTRNVRNIWMGPGSLKRQQVHIQDVLRKKKKVNTVSLFSNRKLIQKMSYTRSLQSYPHNLRLHRPFHATQLGGSLDNWFETKMNWLNPWKSVVALFVDKNSGLCLKQCNVMRKWRGWSITWEWRKSCIRTRSEADIFETYDKLLTHTSMKTCRDLHSTRPRL